MHYSFSLNGRRLHAELLGRRTVQETLEFIQALAAEVERTGATRVLLWVRNSLPIFKVEKYGLSNYVKQLAENPQYRVALLASSEEVRRSHEYIEVLARQRHANVRVFRDEADAVDWLEGDATGSPAEGEAAARLAN
jgi:hypothetical protein